MADDSITWYVGVARLVRKIRRKSIDAREKLQEDDAEAASTILAYLRTDLEELKEQWERRLPAERLGNLARHLHFGEAHDYRDILLHDLPAIEARAEEELAAGEGPEEEGGRAPLPVLLVRAAALQRSVEGALQPDHRGLTGRYFDPEHYLEFFEQYVELSTALRAANQVFAGLPEREVPQPIGDNFDGRGHIPLKELERLQRDLDYVLTVSSEAIPSQERLQTHPERVFISHGRSTEWYKVQAYIDKELGLDTLELAQEPNRGRTVLQKLSEESERCGFAVVVMTGDDVVSDDEAPRRARENVVHEIGFFQAKFGLDRVCLLHEEGTNIPSNIHGLVYSPFPRGRVEATFGDLRRELIAAGFSIEG